MNAGTDYKKARAQAQANADRDGEPRWLHLWNGVWWISRTPLRDRVYVHRAEMVSPRPQPTKKTGEKTDEKKA